MYVGATTHVLLDEMPLPEVLRRMLDAGFEGGELSLIHLREIFDADRPEAAAEQLRATCEDLDFPLPQVHLSVAAMGTLDAEKRENDLAWMER